MDLENKFFYRLVKVLRIASIAFFIIAIPLWLLWNTSDNLRSYFGSYASPPTTAYLNALYNPSQQLPLGWALSDLQDVKPTKQKIIFAKAQYNHTMHLIIFKGLISSIFFYLIINLFSEAVLYLVFQKKLSWQWITFFNMRQKQK